MQGTVNINGTDHAVGQPFCDVIDLDDWVHDFTANDISRGRVHGQSLLRVPGRSPAACGISTTKEAMNQGPLQEYLESNETGTTGRRRPSPRADPHRRAAN